jgi:hypothetical protein
MCTIRKEIISAWEWISEIIQTFLTHTIKLVPTHNKKAIKAYVTPHTMGGNMKIMKQYCKPSSGTQSFISNFH